MQRTLGMILLAAVVGGGWYLWKNYEISGLQQVRFVRRGSGSMATGPLFVSATSVDRSSIRIMSLSSAVIEPDHPNSDAGTVAALQLMREADIAAVYGIRNQSEQMLPLLLEKMNVSGRQYEMLAAPSAGPPNDRRRCAIFFDSTTVETDRRYAYHVGDPENLIRHEPFTAWFRCRGVTESSAFTFSLIVADIDTGEIDRELRTLEGVYTSLRRDERGEDDVILVGNLGTAQSCLRHFEPWNMVCAADDIAPADPPKPQGDLLLFFRSATTEFTGRASRIDIVRRFNLTTDQARQIARQPPIWAEFARTEGGMTPH